MKTQNSLPKPRAILFDWDNTLANTWPIIYASLTETFKEMGHAPWSFEEVMAGRDGIHHSLRDSFPRIFGEEWERAREIYYRHLLEHHLEKITKIEGAHELLSALATLDLYLGVVSNKTGKYLREEVAHLGWEPHFKKIVGATDAKADKPHPDPVFMALDGSGISPSDQVWLVGDSETDLECALRAGIRPVYFGTRSFADSFHSDKRLVAPLVHVPDHHTLLLLASNW